MTDVNQAEKTLAEQIADLVKRKPQHYDVVFSVGPKNVKVKAVKIILKAASSVFESEFEDKWDSAVIKEGDGIPLPHLDPTVFELFIDLIISDTWSWEALKNLNLAPNTLLSLLRLCRHYKITKAIKNLEEAADDFIQNLKEFKDTAEYLEMSLKNLETILSCDSIPLNETEIFDCVWRWADNQCQQKKMESTGENFREVLGSCFLQIRFPTMKMQDFKRVSFFKKNLFSLEEKVAVYDFIATEEDEKAEYDKSQLPFKTSPRNTSGFAVLCLSKQFKIVKNPAYACVGIQHLHRFKVNEKIQLHGVGFLGPIDGDTQFEVTLKIESGVNGSWHFNSGEFRKTIFAQRGNVFYFLLDAPILIERSIIDGSLRRNFFQIGYSLKGARSVLQYKAESPKEESVHISGLEFNLDHEWSSGRPLAQLLFKKH